jgi:hypothetical protein
MLEGHSVNLTELIGPPENDKVKPSAVFEIVAGRRGAGTTMLVVAVRGSAGMGDWLVNFDNGLNPCLDLLVRATCTTFVSRD